MSDEQYPLAYDKKGEPIAIAAGAVAWRVTQARRGIAHALRRADGSPLTVELTTTNEELAEEIGPGKFVLVQIDEQYRTIPDAPTAYVEFSEEATPSGSRNRGAVDEQVVGLLKQMSEQLARVEKLLEALPAAAQGSLPSIVEKQSAGLVQVTQALAHGFAPGSVKPPEPALFVPPLHTLAPQPHAPAPEEALQQQSPVNEALAELIRQHGPSVIPMLGQLLMSLAMRYASPPHGTHSQMGTGG